MGLSFHSTGCVKRAKECWNESHTTNGSPRPAKTKEKPAGWDGAPSPVIVPMMLPLALRAQPRFNGPCPGRSRTRCSTTSRCR
jgi:hypothetical protein